MTRVGCIAISAACTLSGQLQPDTGAVQTAEIFWREQTVLPRISESKKDSRHHPI